MTNLEFYGEEGKARDAWMAIHNRMRPCTSCENNKEHKPRNGAACFEEWKGWERVEKK